MQEKSGIENNKPRTSECWVHVDKSQVNNGNPKCSQKPVLTITKTRNNFGPLRINEELEVRNVINQKVNSGDHGQGVYSSSSVVRMWKAIKTVSTELSDNHEQLQPNRRKKVIIYRRFYT